MYDISELVYGFDFSDGKYPAIGLPLNSDVLEYVIDNEPFVSPYSGWCKNPCYVGIRVTDYSLDDSIFEVCKKYEEQVNNNKEKYKTEIHDKIIKIIENIESVREELVDKDPSMNSLVDEAIRYFELLKTIEPQNCTIHSTS